MSKRIVLTLTKAMYQDITKHAEQLGITPLEYIRFLIMKDSERKGTEK